MKASSRSHQARAFLPSRHPKEDVNHVRPVLRGNALVDAARARARHLSRDLPRRARADDVLRQAGRHRSHGAPAARRSPAPRTHEGGPPMSAPADLPDTVVHVYDDIQEEDNHLPNWWVAILFGA